MQTPAINTQRFIAEYLKDFDPRIAILVAGYKGADAATAGPRLLQEPGIQNEILRVIEARAQALADSTPDLFRKLWLIVNADINELVQVTHGCCRHCWGKDFDYQRTPYERRQLLKRSAEADSGEYYDRRKPPNPDCPECFGEGESRVHHTPSRQLSPAARALCAGYTQTEQGPRLKVHNQQRALEILVRYQNNWIKPKDPPPPERYQSPEDKAREELIRKEWADGTFDAAVHAEREARSSAKQSAERVEWLKGELQTAVRQANAHAATVAALDAIPAKFAIHTYEAHAVTVIPAERSNEESRLVRAAHAVIPPKAGTQTREACAFIPPPLAGGGEGEGSPLMCAPQAHAILPPPPEGGGQGEGYVSATSSAQFFDVAVIPAKAGIQAREACAADFPSPNSGEGQGGGAREARAVAVIPSAAEGSCRSAPQARASDFPSPNSGEGQGGGAREARAVAVIPSEAEASCRSAPQARAILPPPPEGGGQGEGYASATQSTPQAPTPAPTKKDASSASFPETETKTGPPK